MVEPNTCRGGNRCVASNDVERAEGAENGHLSVEANGFGAVGKRDEPLGTRERGFDPDATELSSDGVVWLWCDEYGAAGRRKCERVCCVVVGEQARQKTDSVIVVSAGGAGRIGGVVLCDGHSCSVNVHPLSIAHLMVP